MTGQNLGARVCGQFAYLPVYVVVAETLKEEHDVAESAVARPERWIATKRTECWCLPGASIKTRIQRSRYEMDSQSRWSGFINRRDGSNDHCDGGSGCSSGRGRFGGRISGSDGPSRGRHSGAPSASPHSPSSSIKNKDRVYHSRRCSYEQIDRKSALCQQAESESQPKGCWLVADLVVEEGDFVD